MKEFVTKSLPLSIKMGWHYIDRRILLLRRVKAVCWSGPTLMITTKSNAHAYCLAPGRPIDKENQIKMFKE